MSFFDRNRRELERSGISPDRLPAGQYSTKRFPVLHAGPIPQADLSTWDFSVDGLVTEPVVWTWEEFEAFPRVKVTTDIHCVTKWSKFDTQWQGVPVRDIWDRIDVSPGATHVLVRADHGYTANMPIEDFLADGNLFTNTFDGEPLAHEHGYPMRLIVPHLYFWKSVKWVRGFTVLSEDQPGFWEQNGYHMYGDPFKEQRYWND
ncbi:MAG: sulfite oxidase-like oxidoreductase [Acidobacteria bacterium]|nr:MAG: sulfite oxidase-like oxidoreductase [Acidobacteriota bacterium]